MWHFWHCWAGGFISWSCSVYVWRNTPHRVFNKYFHWIDCLVFIVFIAGFFLLGAFSFMQVMWRAVFESVVIVYQWNDEYFYVLVMLAMACLVSAFVRQLWQVGVRTSQSPFGPLHPLWTGCIPVDLTIMCFTDNNIINLVFCSGIVNSDGSAFGIDSKICIYFFNHCLFVD